MIINSVKAVYFSPTNTTEKIVKEVANGIKNGTFESIDLTPFDVVSQEFAVLQDAMVVIGAPVYGGRIPDEAVQRLRKIKGQASLAVVVAVYGNRDYDDALLELRDIAIDQGFIPLAGAVFIGEHSYNSESTPIATGRPDVRDMEKAAAFGVVVCDMISKLVGSDAVQPVQVPGNFPHKEWNPASGKAPVTDIMLCTLCGLCVEHCPTGSITMCQSVITNAETCMLCSACVKVCPEGARIWKDDWIKKAANWLTESCQERKEPEIFF